MPSAACRRACLGGHLRPGPTGPDRPPALRPGGLRSPGAPRPATCLDPPGLRPTGPSPGQRVRASSSRLLEPRASHRCPAPAPAPDRAGADLQQRLACAGAPVRQRAPALLPFAPHCVPLPPVIPRRPGVPLLCPQPKAGRTPPPNNPWRMWAHWCPSLRPRSFPSPPVVLRYFGSFRAAWACLGVALPLDRARWTEREDGYLLSTVGVQPRQSIARTLGRSSNGVKARLRRLRQRHPLGQHQQLPAGKGSPAAASQPAGVPHGLSRQE